MQKFIVEQKLKSKNRIEETKSLMEKNKKKYSKEITLTQVFDIARFFGMYLWNSFPNNQFCIF